MKLLNKTSKLILSLLVLIITLNIYIINSFAATYTVTGTEISGGFKLWNDSKVCTFYECKPGDIISVNSLFVPEAASNGDIDKARNLYGSAGFADSGWLTFNGNMKKINDGSIKQYKVEENSKGFTYYFQNIGDNGLEEFFVIVK